MEASIKHGSKFMEERFFSVIAQSAINCGKVIMPALAAVMLSACMPESNFNVSEAEASGGGGTVQLSPEMFEDASDLASMPEGMSFTWPSMPPFIFNSSTPGDLVYSGGCSSDVTRVSEGLNSITFQGSEPGTYDNCTISVVGDNGEVSDPLEVPSFTVIAHRKINDTGIVLCGDYAFGYSGAHNNALDCAATGAGTAIDGVDQHGDPVPAGQDALFGRDADPADNDSSDGHAGFSFTKLDANGDPLAIQSGDWQAGGNTEEGTYWHCVRDNVTGMVWEVKTDDGGLRDSGWTYSWHDSDPDSNGGDQGLASADECSAGVRCDTASYVQAVNATQLCGYSDWRLPDTEELLSIVSKDRISPAVDTAFFPNMQSGYYWSSVSVSNESDSAWLVNFFMGYEYTLSKQQSDRIRLVRVAD